MAWYNRRADYDQCSNNYGSRDIGWLGGVFIAGFFVTIVLLALGFGLSYSEYTNRLLYWQCAKNPESRKCLSSGGAYVKDGAPFLNKIIFGDKPTMLSALNKRLAPEQEKDKLKRFVKEKIIQEAEAGAGRVNTVALLCSNGGGLGYVCNDITKAYQLQNNKTIEISQTVWMGFLFAGCGAYLVTGLIFMAAFIAHFGRPSGGLIGWMAVFAPIFVPFWTVVGLRTLGITGWRGGKTKLGAYRQTRAEQKKAKEEARLVGEEVIRDREEINRLTKDVQSDTELGPETKKELLARLKQARDNNEREAKLRVQRKDLASVRARASELTQEVDSLEASVAGREEARKSTWEDEDYYSSEDK